MNTPNGYEEIITEFGDPNPYIGDDGRLTAQWESDNLGYAVLPMPLPLDWNRAVRVNKIHCHKLLIETFETLFEKIIKANLQDKVLTYGGCYADRAQRGASKMSTHAWGIAIDLNCFQNAMGTMGSMNGALIEVFQECGFYWGGLFDGDRRDPMHFQFATGY